MKTPFSLSRFATALLASLVLSACASGPNVISNKAPDFAIADYRTFGFMEPLSTDRDGVRTLLSQRLVDAATRELEAKGLAYSEKQPDLRVNFLVSTRETLSSRPSSGVNVGVRAGRYGTWGGYSVGVGTSTADVVQRTEGTLAIDIIDASRNTLVWEGALSGRVTDKVRENLGPAIDKAVVDILSKFP
jgi:hypothetical protein